MHSFAPHATQSALRAAYIALVAIGYTVRSSEDLAGNLRVDTDRYLVEVQPELEPTHLTAVLEAALRIVAGCDQMGAAILTPRRPHLYCVN